MAKEKPASEKVVTSITSLANDFIRSETNANNFIDILEFLEVDLYNYVAVLKMCISCIDNGSL